MKPYEYLPEEVEHNGIIYPLDLSYSTFFAVADVLDDKRLYDHQKLKYALDMFVLEQHPIDGTLLSAIYDLLKDDRPRSGTSYIDIEQDWSYICAGFQQAYGIDLYSDKDIHILRWQALLQGLPKDTKIMEIIGIRAAEMPEPSKYNQKQIAEMARLKAFYALKNRTHNFQSGLGGLFDFLEARAKE